jgi:hypothetical protein
MEYLMAKDAVEAPGLSYGLIPEITAQLEGGTLDGTRFQGKGVLDTGNVIVNTDPATIRVAVRTCDQQSAWFPYVQNWPYEEKTYEESERYARALARSWHLEEYAFVGWHKPGRLRFRVATYRFVRARAIVTYADDKRWTLHVGTEIAILTGGDVGLQAKLDQWDRAYRTIEDACAAFHHIVELFGDTPIADAVDGPRAAVESNRQEAKLLAKLGQETSSVDDPNHSLANVIDDIAEQLEVRRKNVVAAVRLISEVHLRAVAAAPNVLRSEGLQELCALHTGISELVAHPAELEPSSNT